MQTLDEKNFKELYEKAIEQWIKHKEIEDNKKEEYYNFAKEYINKEWSWNYFFEYNELPEEIEIDFTIFLDRIFLFQEQVFQMKELIEDFQNGPPDEEIFGKYDYVYKLIFIRFLTLFENMVETYTKAFKIENRENKYKKININFDFICKENLINLIDEDNIFKLVNFLRKIIIHPEECQIGKNFLILKDFSIFFKKDLKIKYLIYDSNLEKRKTINQSLDLNDIFSIINKIVNGNESWINIFSKLLK